MTDVEQQWQQQTQAAEIVRALLNEFGALTEYRVLRDSLPRASGDIAQMSLCLTLSEDR